MKLVKFHKSHGKAIIMSSNQPEGRFGALNLMEIKLESFLEKPKGDGGWINIGILYVSQKYLIILIMVMKLYLNKHH